MRTHVAEFFCFSLRVPIFGTLDEIGGHGTVFLSVCFRVFRCFHTTVLFVFFFFSLSSSFLASLCAFLCCCVQVLSSAVAVSHPPPVENSLRSFSFMMTIFLSVCCHFPDKRSRKGTLVCVQTQLSASPRPYSPYIPRALYLPAACVCVFASSLCVSSSLIVCFVVVVLYIAFTKQGVLRERGELTSQRRRDRSCRDMTVSRGATGDGPNSGRKRTQSEPLTTHLPVFHAGHPPRTLPTMWKAFFLRMMGKKDTQLLLDEMGTSMLFVVLYGLSHILKQRRSYRTCMPCSFQPFACYVVGVMRARGMYVKMGRGGVNKGVL